MLIAALLVLPIGLQGAEDTPHWDYEGPDGPQHWGDLAPEFDMCSRGRNQSPIDLVGQVETELPELTFEYRQPFKVDEVNTGHAIQENVIPGNFVSWLEKRFELRQFHFHSPSEHTVDGGHYAMEVHLVHQNEAGEYLVVGLLFEEGEHNDMMDQLPSFRAERGEEPIDSTFDYNEFVTRRQHYFYYNGSLTTPPCTEGVRWVVMREPITASGQQIQHYHDLLGFDNNRPIQPRNARVVLE
jgi:carbonic anhydrase